MLVPVPRPLLQAQAYDDALRAACDTLSAQGVRNFIHYREPRRVELFDPPRWLEPIVDHAAGGIRFQEVHMPNLVSMLQFEEGWSPVPYYDSRGYPTIGHGFLLGPKGAPLEHYWLHITRATGMVWLSELIQSTVADMSQFPVITAAMAACNDARKAVLISMAYQMDARKLSGFRNTLLAIIAGNWSRAYDEMLNSAWARQTPVRARRQATQMLTGVWANEYKE